MYPHRTHKIIQNLSTYLKIICSSSALESSVETQFEYIFDSKGHNGSERESPCI